MNLWFYIIPNYILAILAYSILGRLLLSIFVSEAGNNYIMKAFVTITDPVVRVFRTMTPQIVPHGIMLVLTFVWLMFMRFVFTLTLLEMDLLPKVSGAS